MLPILHSRSPCPAGAIRHAKLEHLRFIYPPDRYKRVLELRAGVNGPGTPTNGHICLAENEAIIFGRGHEQFYRVPLFLETTEIGNAILGKARGVIDILARL